MWVWVVPSDMSYCLTWCGRSDACAMTRGEVIRHPGGVAAVRSPVFRHAGSWRHAGTVRRASHQSHPGGGAGLSRPPWHVSCCVSMLCVAITACHHLRGGIFVGGVGGPRMSPTPRSAKYGATHGCNPSRGSENVRLRSSSPPVAVGQTLRCARRCDDGARCGCIGGKPRGGVPDLKRVYQK